MELELFNADCFDILPEIKDKSVDLFLLDLPYNQTSCNWDKDVIDLEKMWVQIKRTMKPNAIIIMFCTAKFGYKLIHSNPKWFRYDLIWKKSRKVGFLRANKAPLRQHENIYVFKDNEGTYNPQKTYGHKVLKYSKPAEEGKEGGCKTDFNEGYYSVSSKTKWNPKENDGSRHPTSIIEHDNIYVFNDKQGTYNPQKTEGKPYVCEQGQQKQLYGKQVDTTITKNTGDRHPTSIIENTVLEFKNPKKSLHRTQKPVELCEWLIKSYSNEGDVVCDFCMGSGTVGVASVNTKRKFIGVEKDDEIFEIAYNRIHKI